MVVSYDIFELYVFAYDFISLLASRFLPQTLGVPETTSQGPPENPATKGRTLKLEIITET